MPVSSLLKIRCEGNLYLSITASNRSKNLLTVWGLKDLSLAVEVASGCLKDSSLCRCINPCSQSLPAFLLAFLKEFGKLFFSASYNARFLTSLVVKPNIMLSKDNKYSINSFSIVGENMV